MIGVRAGDDLLDQSQVEMRGDFGVLVAEGVERAVPEAGFSIFGDRLLPEVGEGLTETLLTNGEAVTPL